HPALAGCNRDDGPCTTASDCDAEQHCLVDHDSGEGQCLATPGRAEAPPPLRWFANAGHTDLLLVVDDGPGTAAIQARLVASLDALVEPARLRNDDLRVAVTTTTVASPACDSGSEGSGALVAHSCLDRLDDFVGPDGTDARWLCTDACRYTSEELGLDATHPWLDVRRLPASIEPADALACLVPQGISGCEYAAPLEALQAALDRESADDAVGWLRYPWPVQVVVATDGVDCSLTPEGAAAFDPAGARALWSDPTADAPTEAVCWSAGVVCEGDPQGYDDCMATDVGLDGAPTETSPVLVPMSTYETGPRPDYTLSLHVIGGVPVDDPQPAGYSAAGDPQWLLEHGVDPGCSDDELAALPPVRLRDLAEGFASACAPDYRDVLGARVGGASICLPPCQAEALQITYEPIEGEPVAIPACAGAFPDLQPPEGAPACWHLEADSPGCAQAEPGAVELRMHTTEIWETGAFLLEPNLVSPRLDLPGCAS
ncbi:MAG: hypothetical protein KDK70_21250, partial [Myxococcales bacterium]|nr:hypothetical protein [Myxococcales bacterium]